MLILHIWEPCDTGCK